MEKRGSAHLEMILAFTIFIAFVVFLLIYLRPVEEEKLAETVLISLKNSFVETTETELITVFVNGTAPEKCAPPEISNKNWTYKNIKDNTYSVFFSDEFDTNNSRCDPLVNNQTGSIISKKVLSNNSLEEIREKYYSDYHGLKESLKVPKTSDFEIYSEDSSYSLKRSSPPEVSILARLYKFEIVDSSGDLTTKDFIFRVW